MHHGITVCSNRGEMKKFPDYTMCNLILMISKMTVVKKSQFCVPYVRKCALKCHLHFTIGKLKVYRSILIKSEYIYGNLWFGLMFHVGLNFGLTTVKSEIHIPSN